MTACRRREGVQLDADGNAAKPNLWSAARRRESPASQLRRATPFTIFTTRAALHCSCGGVDDERKKGRVCGLVCGARSHAPRMARSTGFGHPSGQYIAVISDSASVLNDQTRATSGMRVQLIFSPVRVRAIRFDDAEALSITYSA